MVVIQPEAQRRPQADAGQLAMDDMDPAPPMDADGIVTRGGHPLSPGAALKVACLREAAGGARG
jgi:hypothetical protein